MLDRIIDKLELTLESVHAIENYMRLISTAKDFDITEHGAVYFDAIMMRLQIIGENCKKILKLNPVFFDEILVVDINNITRFRDLISHHYEKLDRDIVFGICNNNIPALKQKIEEYLTKQ